MSINRKRTILKIIIISIILMILSISSIYADETKNYVDDTIGIFNDEKLLNSKLVQFKNDNNIELYVYTIDSATQETFEETMKDYTTNIDEDFVLFYIAKNNGNVGIYTSDSLKDVITDANKMLLLKSMETNISINDYDGAMYCAISNLEKILENINDEEITHEQLDVTSIEKNQEKNKISVIFMAISSIIIIGLTIYLVVSKFKEIKNGKENT